MRKVFFLLMALITALAASNGFAVADPTPPIDKDEAIEILMSDVIKPSSGSYAEAAFMLSEPLSAGDNVTSEEGSQYPITADQWFIFVDLMPDAGFEHPVLYTFIDVATGVYSTVPEGWPPMINGYSLWDPLLETFGHGHLIEIYSILDESIPVSGTPSPAAPPADYGDAPDDVVFPYSGLVWGYPGDFPTRYDTANSLTGLHGAHAVNVGQEMLGDNVSQEHDAVDPSDPDGSPNLVGSDKDERMFLIKEQNNARLCFDVTVATGAPSVDRYVNALLDFDQNGRWNGTSEANGEEWPVVNMLVNVTPGTTATCITPSFAWGSVNPDVSPVWIRVSLSREQVDPAYWLALGGWDGSGEFQYGEIEDFLALPTILPPHPEPVPDPDPLPVLPIVQNPGPCGTEVKCYGLVVSFGDCWEHLDGGAPIVRNSTDSMYNLLKDRCSAEPAYLQPPNNTKDQITAAFQDLAQKVKCIDRVIIYFCGHGSKNGGYIQRYRQNGSPISGDGGQITADDLAGWLQLITACDKEDCKTEKKNCFTTVIIESCYSGKNFQDKIDPSIMNGKDLITTSSSTVSWASGGPNGMGNYTKGFVDAYRTHESDLNDDEVVEPREAHEYAKGYAHEAHPQQVPKEDFSQCECTPCPCKCPQNCLVAAITCLATETGLSVTVATPEGLSVTFDEVATAGLTTFAPSCIYPGFCVPCECQVNGAFLDISTTATYTGDVRLSIPYNETGIVDETKLRVFHWNGTGWTDVTTFLDTDSNVICAQSPTLSPFFVCDASPGAAHCQAFPSTTFAAGAALVMAVLGYVICRRMMSQAQR